MFLTIRNGKFIFRKTKSITDENDSILGYCANFVEVDRRFRGDYCLHHQDGEALISTLKHLSTSTRLHGGIFRRLLSSFSPLREPEISQKRYSF
jgi:hypothetical protein